METTSSPSSYSLQTLGDNSVVIRASVQAQALQALQERVRKPDTQGRGLYMDEGVLNARTLEDAANAWTQDAIEFFTDKETGDIVRLRVWHTTEAGRLALLFNTLAPYIDAGSHLALIDSTRAVWDWDFDGERAYNEYRFH